MITFPIAPRGTKVTPRLVRTGGDLVSALGGPTQRITRIGSRYAAQVELPTLDADCAAKWLACPLLAEAAGDTLAFIMPQMLDPSGINIAGTGSAGSNQVTYAGGGHPAPGMWFSVQVGGRHYLHLVTAQTGANKVSVSPLLRVDLTGQAMDLNAPKLEGFCDTDTSWSVEFFRFVGHSFTITENA